MPSRLYPFLAGCILLTSFNLIGSASQFLAKKSKQNLYSTNRPTGLIFVPKEKHQFSLWDINHWASLTTCQLGWLFPTDGKIIHSCSKPPTRLLPLILRWLRWLLALTPRYARDIGIVVQGQIIVEVNRRHGDGSRRCPGGRCRSVPGGEFWERYEDPWIENNTSTDWKMVSRWCNMMYNHLEGELNLICEIS